MTSPPTQDECTAILRFLRSHKNVEDAWEADFIQSTVCRDDLTDGERWEVWELVKKYLRPLPITLERELNQLSKREA